MADDDDIIDDEVAQLRRWSRWFGPLLGLAFCGLFRLLSLTGPPHKGSITADNPLPILGDLHDWPGIFRGFWLLDIATACAWGYLTVRLLGVLLIDVTDEDRLQGWGYTLKRVATLCLGIGAFCAMGGSGEGGWFEGLTMFPFGLIVVPAFIGFLCGIFLGPNWLLDRFLGWRASRRQQAR